MDTRERREKDTALFRYETNKSSKHDADWYLQKKYNILSSTPSMTHSDPKMNKWEF